MGSGELQLLVENSGAINVTINTTLTNMDQALFLNNVYLINAGSFLSKDSYYSFIWLSFLDQLDTLETKPAAWFGDTVNLCLCGLGKQLEYVYGNHRQKKYCIELNAISNFSGMKTWYDINMNHDPL